MNFAPDTFESIHRRKKLAAWLATLRGPKKAPRLTCRHLLNSTALSASGGGNGGFPRIMVVTIGGGGGGAGGASYVSQ